MNIRNIVSSTKFPAPLPKPMQLNPIRVAYARACGTPFSLVRSILIPLYTKMEYLALLCAWDHGVEIGRHDFYRVYSALNRCTYAIPTGRLHLRAFHQLHTAFAENVTRFPTHEQPSIPLSFLGSLNVNWWRKWLSSPSPLAPDSDHPEGGEFFTDNRQPRIFVDASGWGVGIIINDHWFAWQFAQGWNDDGRENHWGEMIAIELALRYITGNPLLFPPTSISRIRIHSDSKLAITALKNRRGYSTPFAASVERIYELCNANKVKVEPEFLLGKETPADVPSRGYVPSTSKLTGVPPLPEVLAASFRSW